MAAGFAGALDALPIFAKLGVADRTAAVTAAVTAALQRGVLSLG